MKNIKLVYENFYRRKIKMSTNNVKNQSPQELIVRFKEVMTRADEVDDNKSLLKEANDIAEQVIKLTCQNYENTSSIYREVRGNRIKPIDEICWTALNKCVSRYVSTDRRQVSILDVGTGNGRDIIYGQSLGYDMVGIDNCNGFIEILAEHCSSGLIKENSYKKCDMRELDFPDKSFNVVRHNASLLHLPLIGKGYTVDLALSEAHRVLKPKGLLYIFVKTGLSLEFHDTSEGLGGRIFQFFSHKSLNEVVTRNGFVIVDTSDEVEIRDNGTIDWILLVAQKEG